MADNNYQLLAVNRKKESVKDSKSSEAPSQKSNLEISINPDPIKKGRGFTVIINNNEEAELKIIDVLGKLVVKRTIRGTTVIENSLERGIFLLTIKTSTNSVTKKLIVE
jgi:hypothetical protein